MNADAAFPNVSVTVGFGSFETASGTSASASTPTGDGPATEVLGSVQ